MTGMAFLCSFPNLLLGPQSVFRCRSLRQPFLDVSHWPAEVFSFPMFAHTSALFEIYPILVAAVTWGLVWSGKSLIFFTGNLATAKIINKDSSGSLLIMSFVHRLTWWGLTYKFNFLGEFISGNHNSAADSLSRFIFPQFFLQHPEAEPVGKPDPPYYLMIIG